VRPPTLSLLPLALLLAVTACGDAAGPAQPLTDRYDHALVLDKFRIHQTQVIPIEGFSGINPCTGEETAIAGQAIIRTNGWGDEGDVLHLEETTVVSGSGVGVTSGARYDLSETFHHSFNSPSDEAVHGTLTEHDIVRVRAHGAAGDYVVHTLQHLSVNGRGIVTVEFFRDGVECRG
jgi:hypothetical protein